MVRKEKYKLQRVLELRESARNSSAEYLCERRNLLLSERKELEKRVAAVEKCRIDQITTDNQMIEDSRNGIKSSEFARYRQHLSDLRDTETQLIEKVDDQKAAVSRAEQAVESALNALQEATKEVKVIEKHREKWQAAKDVGDRRREQKSHDEIGAILHNRSDSI